MHTSMIGMALAVLLAVLISSSECGVVGRPTYAPSKGRRTTPMTPTGGESGEVVRPREEEEEEQEVRSRALGDSFETITDKMYTKGPSSKWVTRGMHSGEDVETSTMQGGFRPRGINMHSGEDHESSTSTYNNWRPRGMMMHSGEFESSSPRTFHTRGMHSGEELDLSTPSHMAPRGMKYTPMDTLYTRSFDMDDTESSTHGWMRHNVNPAYPVHEPRGVNQPRPIDWEQKSTPSSLPQGGHSTPRGSKQ